MSIPRYLIESLRDPFEMFPLEHALRDIGKLIAEAESELYSSEVPHWSRRQVPQEMQIEAISTYLGACFVTAQAMITRTVSVIERMRDLGAGAVLPPKRDLPAIESVVVAGIADIVAINALANYFKHNDEWPDGWVSPAKNSEFTVATVKSLGLTPRHPDNMLIGARSLGFDGEQGAQKLANRLGEWRSSLADRLERDFAAAGLMEPSRHA